MPKQDRTKLWEKYLEILGGIWAVWDSVQDHEDIEDYQDPFGSTYFVDITELNDEQRDLFHRDVGWILGVSEVTGWSKEKPGPRKWSPRDPGGQ